MSEIWSSLGGNMGLFLGMSLLSAIEIIIYVFKISWLFFSRKRREHMIAKREKVDYLVGSANGYFSSYSQTL